MTRELVRTPGFVRAVRRYLKQHPEVDSDLEDALKRVAADVYDPRLKTHKLSGRLSGVWACSAGYDLRILFEFGATVGKEAILLLTVGSHDDVY